MPVFRFEHRPDDKLYNKVLYIYSINVTNPDLTPSRDFSTDFDEITKKIINLRDPILHCYYKKDHEKCCPLKYSLRGLLKLLRQFLRTRGFVLSAKVYKIGGLCKRRYKICKNDIIYNNDNVVYIAQKILPSSYISFDE